MAGHGYELEHLDTAYPEIQADTLEETIVPGLTWLVSKYDRPVIIDDSGFFVDALKGFPGVFSSYVYRTIGCEGILRLMEGRPDRSARFECCSGFMTPGDEPFIAEGVAKGTVSHEMKGSGGFGYDPIFINEGHTKTYAELDVDEKNKASHRGKAIESFVDELPRLM
ncbi:MAG: RdgB/HAM1 family non-canonical purine NTP pyrophosphatase [Thermoplasmata archaeon]